MTFLSPSILFGLIAAAIPVMIHLLNLRRLKKVEFSTLAFLKEIQKSKIRRVKLKQWILLALRVLIIVLLVTAFARPTLESAIIDGTVPTAKSSVVIILDNTFSMSAVSENGSLLNHAKQMIGNILSGSVQGDEYSLILASDADMKIKPPVSNKKELIKIIDVAGISQVSGTVEEALYRANDILMKSDNLNKHIYLLTDFQKSRLHNTNEQSLENAFSISEDINLYLFDYSLPDIVNLSIPNFETNNQVFEVNKQISFTATITNHSDATINNTIASLFINGKREAQHSISLTPHSTTQVSFETTLKKAGLIKIECTLEDDNILNDNTRYLSIYVPDEISILLMADNFDDTKYLELALSGAHADNFKITKRRTDQAGAIDLKKYDVVFLVGTELISDYSNLIGYLSAGGKIVLMPGEKSTLPRFRYALRELRLPEPAGIIGDANIYQSSASFDKIDFSHPIFANMFEEDGGAEIESPSFYNYFAVKTEGLGKSIINLNTGYSFMSEFRLESGTVLLFNCAPVLSKSNFPVKGIFAPLINKLVYYLSSNANTENRYIAGDDIFVNISGRSVPQLKIIRPDLTTELVNIDSVKSKNFYRYTNTNLTGTYQFFFKNKLFDYAVVNTNPLESNTQHLAEQGFDEFLESINFNVKHTYIPINSDIGTLIEQTRYGSELWKPLLILALFVALLEMIISKSSKKDMVAVTNDSSRI